MTVLHNSSYKVKTGSVPDIANVIPEAGALILNEADQNLYYGDGFNWIQATPLTEGAAITGTGITISLTAATPEDPAEFFDAVVYQKGTAVVPAVVTDNITLANTADYRINYDITVAFDIAGSVIELIILNGVTPVLTLTINTIQKDTNYNVSGSVVISATAADILTMTAESGKTGVLTIASLSMGVSELA